MITQTEKQSQDCQQPRAGPYQKYFKESFLLFNIIISIIHLERYFYKIFLVTKAPETPDNSQDCTYLKCIWILSNITWKFVYNFNLSIYLSAYINDTALKYTTNYLNYAIFLQKSFLIQQMKFNTKNGTIFVKKILCIRILNCTI